MSIKSTDIPHDRLNSILISHFILNLRSIYFKETNDSQPTHSSLSLHFVEGNIGATLDDSWATGREYDGEEDICYSGHPFATGLASILEKRQYGEHDGVEVDTELE